jgi:hypothetical protein
MLLTALLTSGSAFAQQVQPRPAPGAAPPSSNWDRLPRMQLERQFAGPLQDTVIQRWRDPADGAICYIYLPITAEHSPPTQSGFVQYGSNTIGSLSCFPPTRVITAPQAAAPPPPSARANPAPQRRPAPPSNNIRPPAPEPEPEPQ